MSLSIGQIEREKGEYIEIINTGVKMKEVPEELDYKTKILQCYTTIAESLLKLYERFQGSDDKMKWKRVEDITPSVDEGDLYSKEVLVMDRFGDFYLAIFNDKKLTWHDSTVTPMNRIEGITHWMQPTKP